MDAKSFEDLVARVRADFDTTFTWDYDRDGGGLDRLYEKAKRAQWNVSDDLDWSIDVDPQIPHIATMSRRTMHIGNMLFGHGRIGQKKDV